MRIFHFVEAHFGLDDIRRRRLKIAAIDQLNDPFELLGANLKNGVLRDSVHVAKAVFGSACGLLCFSRNWHNPVQWSHYAAKHTGLCLGFDIPEQKVSPITYSAKRFLIDVDQLLVTPASGEEVLKRLLITKYAHWRYEKEMRAVVALENAEGGMYFSKFSEDLSLKVVIVGAQSSVTRAELASALGELGESVEVFKARLAFGTFRVVRQGDSRRWA